MRGVGAGNIQEPTWAWPKTRGGYSEIRSPAESEKSPRKQQAHLVWLSGGLWLGEWLGQGRGNSLFLHLPIENVTAGSRNHTWTECPLIRGERATKLSRGQHLTSGG